MTAPDLTCAKCGHAYGPAGHQVGGVACLEGQLAALRGALSERRQAVIKYSEAERRAVGEATNLRAMLEEAQERARTAEQKLKAALLVTAPALKPDNPTDLCAGFESHPWAIYAEDFCVAAVYIDGRPRYCGQPRSAHAVRRPETMAEHLTRMGGETHTTCSECPSPIPLAPGIAAVHDDEWSTGRVRQEQVPVIDCAPPGLPAPSDWERGE